MIDGLLYCTSGCLTYSGILLAIIQEYYLTLTVAEKGKSVFFSGVSLDILSKHQKSLYSKTKYTLDFFFFVWFGLMCICVPVRVHVCLVCFRKKMLEMSLV